MMRGQPRLVADGLVCHSRNWANSRPALLSDEADRDAFLQALGWSCGLRESQYADREQRFGLAEMPPSRVSAYDEAREMP
jgi:hypothetical protein